jgi:hypothetical protein
VIQSYRIAERLRNNIAEWLTQWHGQLRPDIRRQETADSK